MFDASRGFTTCFYLHYFLDEILYLGDSTVVLQCSIPDALSTSWFVFNQPFPDSLLTGTCSVLGSGTQMQCSVSTDLDNVTLRCEADDGSQTHSRIYRIYVEGKLVISIDTSTVR